jgi:DNA invertase Pin-like site-specific DNA recombinase
MVERVIGYTRVSTAEQTEGYGTEAQERAIRAYCRTHKVRLVDVASDQGLSGSNGLESRRGLAHALARLEAGEADAIVVSRLDRLARSYVLQETIIERLQAAGRSVISVSQDDVSSSDPERVLVRQILGSIGQYEAAVIRGRMAAGKAVKRAKGGYLGGNVEYGKRLEGDELVEDPDEVALIERVRTLHAEGHSFRQICDVLEVEGFKPRRASSWSPMVVRRIALR